MRQIVDRVTVETTMIRIALSVHAAEDGEADTLSLPWTASSPHRRREIIQGANEEVGVARPMPHGARVILIDAIRQAHRWLGNLLSNPNETVEAIASREGKTERSIRMTLSLAFLAPGAFPFREPDKIHAALIERAVVAPAPSYEPRRRSLRVVVMTANRP